MPKALVPATFADYRELARRRLIHRLFEYIDGGSYAEVTLRDNVTDLDRLRIRQRVLRDVSRRTLGTTVLGQPWSMPVALAPVGLAGMFRRRGEVQALRAAEAAGVPFTLSTVGICSIEEVAGAATQPFWFQLYIMRDRGFVAEVIQRAQAARCGALVVTVDLAVPGARYRDIRSGMMGGVPLAGRLALAADLLRHAGWVWDLALRGRPLVFGTIAPILPKAHMLRDFVGWVGKNFDAGVTWKDVEWIRARWNGPLIVKGVLDPDDARAAVHAGAQAVVVSNHGGRQLDSVPSTVAALPAIVDAVGGSAEVLFDGGVRSGLDVFKALALGAKGALMGRAWAFALAALGESGVTRMLGTVQKELDAAMALSGVTSIAEIGRDALVRDPTAPAVEIRR
jgi:L-lactate dehydrogenase (cytochrome)